MEFAREKGIEAVHLSEKQFNEPGDFAGAMQIGRASCRERV